MKKFAYFNVGNNKAMLPAQNANENASINYRLESMAELLAKCLADAHSNHGYQYYYDRIVGCDYMGVHAVTCIANSGESPYGLGHHNVFHEDGSDYLYITNDGTPILANVHDEWGETYYRIHTLEYAGVNVFPFVPTLDYRMGQKLIKLLKKTGQFNLNHLKSGKGYLNGSWKTLNLDEKFERWIYEQFAKVIWSNPDMDARVRQLRYMPEMGILNRVMVNLSADGKSYHFSYCAGQDYTSEIRFIQNKANKW